MDGELPESSGPSLGADEEHPTAESADDMNAMPHVGQTTPTGCPNAEGTNMALLALSPDEDDDVVLVDAGSKSQEPEAASPTEAAGGTADASPGEAVSPSRASESPASAAVPARDKDQGETIVIDDEDESLHASSAPRRPACEESSLSSTEPDSEIRIASVTTLGADTAEAPSTDDTAVPSPSQQDMNLMIANVTSLQDDTDQSADTVGMENSLQISNAFSLNPGAQSHGDASAAGRPATHYSSPGNFNPGRVANTREPVHNGETGTHQRPDSWISQSASFPRNQKQPGADSPSPAAPLPKPPTRSPLGHQQPPRTVKVTCANCKKPLKKGQTAYQRKGSAHLFCSTTCLSAFSHKPAPKKNCTMCKKDITSMKGTIVAQVDSSESFQEFCSTGCLGTYENKQNPPKSALKPKCTVCGKLTEIRHEVSFKNVTHKICSDACFNRYRMANGLIMNCCEQCGNYLPSRASANHFLVVDGQQKRFCCQNCVRDFKQANGKMISCMGCGASCRLFDVTHCISSSGTMEPYCSTTCMSAHRTQCSSPPALCADPTCHYCKKSSLPQYQATLPDGKVYNFCSSECVTKFQNASLQITANGQPAQSTGAVGVHLKCGYCRGVFSLKPETLEWENKVYQFCSKACCEDYKKLHCIVTFCEYCQEEKTLHETVKFSGVKRPFCSEGCKLLFKQEFVRRLGLKCVTCNHCSQMCKRSVTQEIDNMLRDFCSETCAKKFHDWYYKAARCDCCKVQGTLLESVEWREEMKHFCDQQCLLRFYCQQNEPNMATQKGPENMIYGYGAETAAKASMAAFPGATLLKDAKNKAVLCKPLTMTKATYCKPHMQSKPCQTEEAGPVEVVKEYVPIPIPVPVYIPVPMNMYSQATPAVLPLPVPVPVPLCLPTTADGEKLSGNDINDLVTIPSHHPIIRPEKDVDEEEKLNCAAVKNERVRDEDVKQESCSSSDDGESEDSYDPELDLEIDVPQVVGPDLTTDLLDTDMGFTLPLLLGYEEEQSRPLVKRKGRKRKAVDRGSPPQSPNGACRHGSLPLKSHYGVNAWKRWALTSTDLHQPEEGNPKHGDGILLRQKRDLLSLPAAELNHSLSRFITEARRPHGETYAPDSIFYLCLGLQQHLQEKGRTDDIFNDPCYKEFGQELNKILNGWQPIVLPDGSLWSRVEERHLWASKQLGSHSSASLLRSLVYLNSKYFGLRTVEQHLRLSFANVYELRKTGAEPSVCVRIPSVSLEHQVKSSSGKRRRKDNCEADSKADCPLRKHETHLYELYLSKCPATMKHRTDVFYMTPEVWCSRESSLWYSNTPLERDVLESILSRTRLSRDVYSQPSNCGEDGE